MLRAKFFISLAVIAAIHQFYIGPSTAMATTPAAGCEASSSVADNTVKSNDASVINASMANCSDATSRRAAVVADKA
ncbi:MAG: hypothetical protein JWP29_5263 [Rhodoferax sp.]|nr:hypothetical protein [Rhodoferax sp.]